MASNYLYIYNNFVELTRNKNLYKNFKSQDIFYDRLLFLLLHFAFFLKVFKNKENKKQLQEIYDFIFRQLELSIREIGYGDQSINKKMKQYINLFHNILDKLNEWEESNIENKSIILKEYGLTELNDYYLTNYFEKYRLKLLKNYLKYYIKGVIKD